MLDGDCDCSCHVEPDSYHITPCCGACAHCGRTMSMDARVFHEPKCEQRLRAALPEMLAFLRWYQEESGYPAQTCGEDGAHGPMVPEATDAPFRVTFTCTTCGARTERMSLEGLTLLMQDEKYQEYLRRKEPAS